MTTLRAERTRARLQACALELFTAQGYDATTVEQIATAAGVSHMTFFRHFPTKESVLVEDPYDPLIAEAVRAQPTDLPPLERVRRGLLGAWSAVPRTRRPASRGARAPAAGGRSAGPAPPRRSAGRTGPRPARTPWSGSAGRTSCATLRRPWRSARRWWRRNPGR